VAMSTILDAYLRLERGVVAAKDAGYKGTATILRTQMDDLWLQLDEAQREQLNRRGELFQIPRGEVGVIFGLPFEYMLHTLPGFAQPPRVGDIGGHCGGFVVYALNRWQGAHVTTYEPHPESFKLLEDNVQGMRCTPHNLAVVPHPSGGKVRLYEGKASFGRHACSLRTDVVWDAHTAAPHNDQDLTKWVDVDTIDAADLPQFDVLKVDHEGGEDETLRRYGKKLDGVSILMVECHATGGDLDRAIRLVRQIAVASGMRYVDIHGTVVRFIRQ
jgi:FkbM family methyltransferase